MPLLASWPTLTDDSGTGQDGTAVNHAWEAAVKSSIEDQVYSSTNPTLRPRTITDEIVTARGNKASLNARLAGVIDADGNILLPASAATVSDVATLAGLNLLPNSDFLIWARGDTAAPAYTTLSGTGAAIARVGSGLADTWQPPYGLFGIKITRGSSAAAISWSVLNTTDFANVLGFRGRKIAVGVWCQASVANQASIVVNDGITATRFGTAGAGTFHPGDGTPKWLSGVHTISNSATKITISVEVLTSGAAYFGNVLAEFSNIAPADFIPCLMQKGVIHFVSSGQLVVGANLGSFLPSAPTLITDVQCLATEVNPAGADIIVDVNSYDSGGTPTSMFTSGGRPRVLDGTALGATAVPDDTYARRCLRAIFDTGVAESGRLTFDLDQVGSGTPGTGLIVEVRTRQYIRALEQFIGYATTI